MTSAIRVGDDFSSPPYLLDGAAAEEYGRALDSPHRSKARPAGIHDDQNAARRAGFRAPIAAGEQTYAILAQFLADRFGMNFMRGGRLDAAFIKPVFFGDALISHARVEKIESGFAELAVWIDNDHGERVAAGSARIRI